MAEEQKPNIPNVIHARAGKGGSSFLVIGEEKAALIDAGMAFGGPELTAFVEDTLQQHGGPSSLDYVLLTHSHYDHIGGLPFLKRRWPDLVVLGSPRCKQVLERPGALTWIRELANSAAVNYGKVELTGPLHYQDEELKVDAAIREGDVVDLGGTRIAAIETPGHTRCALSFYLPMESVLFPSETMGTIELYGESMLTGIMTSMEDSLDSIIRCRSLKAQHIVSPHFGLIHDHYVEDYWDWALKGIFDAALLFYESQQRGQSEDEMLNNYREAYCTGFSTIEQPDEAYQINTRCAIQSILRELDSNI